MKPKAMYDELDEVEHDELDEATLNGWCDTNLGVEMDQLTLDWSRPMAMLKQMKYLEHTPGQKRKMVQARKVKIAAAAEAAMLEEEENKILRCQANHCRSIIRTPDANENSGGVAREAQPKENEEQHFYKELHRPACTRVSRFAVPTTLTETEEKVTGMNTRCSHMILKTDDLSSLNHIHASKPERLGEKYIGGDADDIPKEESSCFVGSKTSLQAPLQIQQKPLPLASINLSLEDAITGSLPSYSKKIVHVPTMPLAMMLKLQNSYPRRRPSGADVKELNLSGQQVQYSDASRNFKNNMKGLSDHHGSQPCIPSEREQVERVMGQEKSSMRQKHHLGIQKLEHALHKRETRKIDIEKQLRMVKSITTTRSPPVMNNLLNE